MSGFSSSSVRLGDLGSGDFLAPAPACVNPVFAGTSASEPVALTTTASTAISLPSDGKVRIAYESTADANMPIAAASKPIAKVSLADCLACSGCLTTAETVLLEEQSAGTFKQVLAAGDKTVFVTISRQSLASLAVHYDVDLPEMGSRLVAFLRRQGVTHVLDEAYSVALAREQVYREFQRRRAGPRVAVPWQRPSTTEAVSSTLIQDSSGTVREQRDPPTSPCTLPMLTSACPGFVCFAEKTKPELIPYISTAKSPLAIMGAAVKRLLAPRIGVQAYHCAVMPCADKKLEASRKDFVEGKDGEADIDIVLTTMELAALIDEEDQDEGNGGNNAAAPSFASTFEMELEPENVRRSSSSRLLGSGGYAEHVYRAVAASNGIDVVDVPWTTGRNRDFKSATLSSSDGVQILRVAVAYGFRNVQSVARAIRRKSARTTSSRSWRARADAQTAADR